MSKIRKYLGIDWGQKRIGLASADDELKLALPFGIVSNLAEVLNVVKEEEINIIVLGNPRKMSGAESDNPMWLNFYQQLKIRSGLRIELSDERLSSLAADALEGEASDKAGRDELAAVLILQNYLDKNQYKK